VGRVVGNAGQHVRKPGLRIHIIQFARYDDAVHCSGALSAAIGACEQPRFSAQGNLAVILPISGRMSSSTIVGIRFTDGARGASRASGARRVSWRMWS
jgi:hypothetical protein